MNPTRHIVGPVLACYAFGLLAAIVACAIVPKGKVMDKPDLADAQVFAWRTGFQRTDASPLVKLVTGSELSCTDPVSSTPGFRCGNLCRGGCTLWPTEVSVAWWEGLKWWQSTLVHEYGHEVLIREGIEGMQATPVESVMEFLRDWDHKNPIFRKLEDCTLPQQGRCGLVAKVNQQVADRGW